MKRLSFVIFLLLNYALLTGAEPPVTFPYENAAGYVWPITDVCIDSLPCIEELPDPLLFNDGSKVTDLSDWKRRRAEIIGMLYHYEIGEKPPTPRDSISAIMDGDTLRVTIRNNSQELNLNAKIVYPEGEGPFPAIIGIGFPSGSLPSEIFSSRGIAQIAFDFSEVMSHTQKRGEEPINRIYPDRTEIGAYSAWPWGVSRLIDGLEIVGESSRIDLERIGITGCSFAGKMALFAGALDERIALTIAQEPGGGGVAAWRVSETLENVETLGRTNYSWFMESMRRFAEENVCRLPIDHNELTALVAPRAFLMLGNTDYEWLADPSGYESAKAARKVWEMLGVPERIRCSVIGGHPHCRLPECQYALVEEFVDRFLLGLPQPEVPASVEGEEYGF